MTWPATWRDSRMLSSIGSRNLRRFAPGWARCWLTVHVDIKKVTAYAKAAVGLSPVGGSDQAKVVDRAKTVGSRAGYVYLRSTVDGDSRPPTYRGSLRRGILHSNRLVRRVRGAAHDIAQIHRIVAANGACYRARTFEQVVAHRYPHW